MKKKVQNFCGDLVKCIETKIVYDGIQQHNDLSEIIKKFIHYTTVSQIPVNNEVFKSIWLR